ncbi:MAG: exodeoxyribonuclease VII large subunit [Deltaproteobacteria bacterium]|nr:MAG: exodeoxyribonuclease VII large subunit [Deltaproteobacteria bacterium]
MSSPPQHIYNVSELNRKIKAMLEERYPFIWISGEISNFTIPSSGHCYFTLKDAASQIRAVMFRSQANSLKFRPQDGLKVIGLGRVSVYEPRGAYQIIFEYLEPKGIGGLQLAFDKLKRRLADEGLFDQEHKIPLPQLPKTIGLVTSPTGAAVRDFINIALRRFDNLAIDVVPVRVQGDAAPADIVRAIDFLNYTDGVDVIVLARGGGSIEDLWAFNSEQVARSIFRSQLPVVSAIGHETDFTIADFVADVRAPTPSAAAELVVPAKDALSRHLDLLNQSLYQSIQNSLNINRKILMSISDRIVHPKRRLQDMRLRLDDVSQRLAARIKETLSRRRERLQMHRHLLIHMGPGKDLMPMKERVGIAQRDLTRRIRKKITDCGTQLEKSRSMLDALNPMAILQRGYSITRTCPEEKVVRSAERVKRGQALEVLLGRGRLTVRVREKHNNA